MLSGRSFRTARGFCAGEGEMFGEIAGTVSSLAYRIPMISHPVVTLSPCYTRDRPRWLTIRICLPLASTRPCFRNFENIRLTVSSSIPR